MDPAIYSAIIGLLLTALCGLIAFFGTGIRNDIQTLTKKVDDHIKDDSDKFTVTARERGELGSRVAKCEGKLGI
jgi:hypothetical protein